MNGQNRKQQLAQFIDEVSFALDDVVLFLDTHPCNQEALACYEEYKKMRKEAMEEYSRCVGPLQKDNVSICNEWTWALQPWPWKGGC